MNPRNPYLGNLTVSPPPRTRSEEKKWYVVEKNEFPDKCVSECDLCHKVVHPGQVVYIDRKKAVELQEPYFVMHKECMQALLEAAPSGPTEIKYEEIRERVQSGGSFF